MSFDVDESDIGISGGQSNIDTLVDASTSWGLVMNISKCVCMRFSPRSSILTVSGTSPYKIGNQPIKFVQSHSDLGITIDRTLKFHSHIRTRVNIASAMTNNILSCTLAREPEFIMNVYMYHIRPQLEYGAPLWNLGYLGDVRLLEGVQRKWTKAVDGLSDLPYSARLDRLQLFSFKGRLLRNDLVLVWKICHNKCAVGVNDLFTMNNLTSGTRGHPLKIFVPRTNLEVRRRFFSVRVIATWNQLSADTVTAANLNLFKSLLHRDLGSLLYEYLD